MVGNIRCEQCKWYWTGKDDDGRFYNCDSKKAKPFVKAVNPDFGCIYFEQEIE